MQDHKSYRFLPRINAMLALGALIFTIQTSESGAIVPPQISNRQAMSFTQAHALVECAGVVDVINGRSDDYYCKLQPNDWVLDRCKVSNPRLPYRYFLGSWASCPFRWWLMFRGRGPLDPPRQQLHGCHFIITRSPARGFKLHGRCKSGTRFPSPVK